MVFLTILSLIILTLIILYFILNKTKYYKIYTFANPYSIFDLICVSIYNILPPSKSYKKNITDEASNKMVFLDSEKKIKILFLGDYMPYENKKITISEELQSFVDDAEIVVINLEGIIKNEKRLLALNHSLQVIDDIKRLFPNKFVIINTLNNHSLDFGIESYDNSCQILKEAGFAVITNSVSTFEYQDIKFNAKTFLSNQQSSSFYVPKLKDYNCTQETFEPNYYHIFLPHWGIEMYRYPQPRQIQLAAELLKHYDFIVGNHSHYPQSIVCHNVNGKNKGVAYSLGDFSFISNMTNYKYGLILKLELSTTELKPELCSINYHPIKYKLQNDEIIINKIEKY